MDTSTSAAPDEKTPPTTTQQRESKLSARWRSAPNDFLPSPVDLKFDKRTSGVSSELQKNARLPEVRGSTTYSAKSTARWPELISSSKLLGRGKASQAHKHFHPALAMAARRDRRPMLSNAFVAG